jgi:hypothetical protein
MNCRRWGFRILGRENARLWHLEQEQESQERKS